MTLFALATLAVAAITALAPPASAQLSYSFLKDVRPTGALTFVPYTDDQKTQTLQQVQNLLDVWVNYRFKLAYYNDTRRSDPFRKLARVKSRIANMTTDQMHFALSNAFLNVRDGHTNYELPGPYRCFTAHTGIFYTFADSEKDITTSPKVVVRGFTQRAGVVELLKDQLSKISIGDELISYDGHSFMNFYKSHVWTAGGANTFGGMRSVLFYMTARTGLLNQLPGKDSVDIAFRSAKTGKRYKVTIPFVVVRDDSCWSVSSSVYANVTGQPLASAKLSTSAPEFLPARLNIDPRKYPLGTSLTPILDLEAASSDDGSIRFGHNAGNDTVEDEQAAPARIINSVVMNPTQISSIYWGIYQPEGKNLGIIRLDDFTPSDARGQLNTELAILVFRSLLVNQLKDTNAVVIDLRSNGGGIISFANGIPQLFKHSFRSMGAKYLRNDINKRIFVDNADPTDSFRKAYEQSSPGDYYTKLGYFDTFEDNNKYGQVYLKPVGVFTDGNCFSSCDLLSANFGNAAIGPVFGEDGQTGGGGANVFEHKNMVQYDPTDFKSLPFFKEMAGGGDSYAHGMRVGIRAGVRNGLHDGEIIEDYGAKTDYVIRPQISDLNPNVSTNTQLERIADKLAEIGKATKKNGLYFVLEPLTLIVTNGSFALTAEVAGLDNLVVYDIKGKQLAMTKFAKSDVKQNVTLQVQSPISDLGNSKIYIESFQGRKRVLKTVRSIRVEPEAADRRDLVKSGSFKWDLELSPFIGIYNDGAASKKPKLGWNKKNNAWVVGTGSKYADNVDTDLRFFFDAPVGRNVTVSLKAKYDTEPGFDFFYANFYDDNKGVPLLVSARDTPFGKIRVPGVSGHNGTIDASFTVETTSEQFELSLEFVSDPAVNFRGVSVSELSVSLA